MKHIARKRFGQNFLVDRAIVDAIVRAIDPRPGDVLVEIGPGLGALTDPLLERLRDTPLHVVELDRDLAARLRKRYPADRLVVHEADALNFDFLSLDSLGIASSASMPPTAAPRLRVVGNLPYNISSPLLFHLMDVAEHVRDQHFMLQKEVVERMVALPGQAAYGRLTVMLRARYDMEMLFEVPPESFDPPPKVMSAIVRMQPLPSAALRIDDFASFGKLVAQAFSQRRKMLRNTLKEHGALLEEVGIEPTARAEEIPVETFVALANRLGARGQA